MKLPRCDLYTLGGLGLIVGALFAAAKAIGGLIALLYFVSSTDFTGVDPSFSDNIAKTWKASQTSGIRLSEQGAGFAGFAL